MKLRNLVNSQLLEVGLLKVGSLLKIEKYRHMCYMFKLAYTLCIAPEKNPETLVESGSYVSMEISFLLTGIRHLTYILYLSVRFKILKFYTPLKMP